MRGDNSRSGDRVPTGVVRSLARFAIKIGAEIGFHGEPYVCASRVINQQL